MLPVTAHVAISASREEVFDFVADLANRTAWMDHCTQELRLTHPRSQGEGAAARYWLSAPCYSHWVETEIVEADRPRRLVERTRGGRGNRSEGEVTFELSRQGRGLTRVEMTVWEQPGTPREAVLSRLAARRWMRRQAKIALERLRTVFEEERDQPLARASVAAWEPQKAPRFGIHTEPRTEGHTGSGRRASSG